MNRRYFHALLISISAEHRKRSRQYFQTLELTEGQPKVLSILREMEGCLQKELAEACHVEPATMTSLLKNMEQRGLIVKERQLVSGKRAYRIYFTEHGRILADKVWEAVWELEDISFAGFSAEEKEQFLQMFHRIQDNLAQ